jgi:hypothetical protein
VGCDVAKREKAKTDEFINLSKIVNTKLELITLNETVGVARTGVTGQSEDKLEDKARIWEHMTRIEPPRWRTLGNLGTNMCRSAFGKGWAKAALMPTRVFVTLEECSL